MIKFLLALFGLQPLRRPVVYRKGVLGGPAMKTETVRDLLARRSKDELFCATCQVIEDLAERWQADAIEASLRPGDEVRHYTGGSAALNALLVELCNLADRPPGGE